VLSGSRPSVTASPASGYTSPDINPVTTTSRGSGGSPFMVTAQSAVWWVTRRCGACGDPAALRSPFSAIFVRRSQYRPRRSRRRRAPSPAFNRGYPYGEGLTVW
jgi:hypothetical protein